MNITILHALCIGFSAGVGYSIFKAAWANLDAIMAAVMHKKLPNVVPCPLCHARAPWCYCEPCIHEKVHPPVYQQRP